MLAPMQKGERSPIGAAVRDTLFSTDFQRGTVLVATYVAAVLLYPGPPDPGHPPPYFGETYFGLVGASVALSFLAILVRKNAWLHPVLLLRAYLLVILGYSLESYLSVKLVLGVGLMTEICLIEEAPYDKVVAALAFAFFMLAQLFPDFLGASSLSPEMPRPRSSELGALALALALASAASCLLRTLNARQKELVELVRLHEANLVALAELNRNLQGYAQTIDVESAERERNRISREIHDISGYIFTNLIALMDAAGSLPRDDQAGLTDLIVSARSQAQEGLRETRIALRKLRSEQNRLTDCTQAIHKIVSIFQKVTKIEVDVSYGNMPHALPQETSLTLYRTIQEALTNAVRHGKATRVRVGFWVENNQLRLSIADNGKGAFAIVKGIGISGMEERIGALGGHVEVGQVAEGGFALRIDIPLPDLVLRASSPGPAPAPRASPLSPKTGD